jgi:hypothetical protein
VVTKQGFFQTMEAGEFGVGGFLLEVVFPCINRRVHVGEQLGNRLDPFVMLAGDGVQALRLFQVTGLDGGGKGLGLAQQAFQLAADIFLVFSNRAASWAL